MFLPRFRTTLLIIALPWALFAQRFIEVKGGCNFSGPAEAAKIEVKDPTPEANKIKDEILAAAGLKQQRFTMLVGTNIKNARATKQDGVRYIFYSQEFLEKFKKDALTRKAAYFLLAHEVGHHALGHNFDETDMAKRQQSEIAADTFATRVMLMLGATYTEVMAGIENFDDDGGSDTHPDKEIRMDFIAVAYQELSKRIKVKPSPSSNDGAAPSAFPLLLDESCFKYKANLVKQATAEIDDEKITISFNFPQELNNRRFKICLLSNDEHVRPEARTPGSVRGTGLNIAYGSNPVIVWNYNMDRYLRTEAGRQRMLRLYVYDMYDLPNPSSVGPELLAGGIGATGLGLGILGAIQMGKGKSIYDNEYKISYQDSDFNSADTKFVRGQYLVGGGIALMVVGGILLRKELRQNKMAQKGLCFEMGPMILEPTLAARPDAMEAGLRLRF